MENEGLWKAQLWVGLEQDLYLEISETTSYKFTQGSAAVLDRASIFCWLRSTRLSQAGGTCELRWGRRFGSKSGSRYGLLVDNSD